MSEWIRAIPVATRIQDITKGGGTNGSYDFTAGTGGTVTSNMQTNDLTDGAGTNWLLYRKGVDELFGSKSSDVSTLL